MSIKELALDYHRNNGIGNGKIEIVPKVSVNSREKLALAYTPGVAVPCLAIEENAARTTITPSRAIPSRRERRHGGARPRRHRLPRGIPVMEGKALLFKIFGGVDAYPSSSTRRIPTRLSRRSSLFRPSHGGINLEDISATRCFEIEQRLSDELDIPCSTTTSTVTAVSLPRGSHQRFEDYRQTDGLGLRSLLTARVRQVSPSRSSCSTTARRISCFATRRARSGAAARTYESREGRDGGDHQSRERDGRPGIRHEGRGRVPRRFGEGTPSRRIWFARWRRIDPVRYRQSRP